MYDPITMRNTPDTAITNERFTELVQCEEKVNVLKRLLEVTSYISIEDLKAILGMPIIEKEIEE